MTKQEFSHKVGELVADAFDHHHVKSFGATAIDWSKLFSIVKTLLPILLALFGKTP